jgi:hypothetical protein
MDRSIKTVQLELVFELQRVMFKELMAGCWNLTAAKSDG